MFKYTLKSCWKQRAKKWYKNGKHYKMPIEEMVLQGWPTDYMSKYYAASIAPDVVFFSKKRLRFVPVAGYLIPVKFFEENECE